MRFAKSVIRRIGRVVGAAFVAVLAIGPSQAQEPPPPPEPPTTAPDAPPEKFKLSDLHLGLDSQLYFPSSRKTRDRFGDVWVSFNPGLGLVEMIAPRTSLRISLEVISNRRRGNNRILMIPLGVAVRRGYGKSERYRPYYGANAAITAYSMRVDADNIGPGLRAGLSFAPLIGVGFRRRAYVEAEYLIMNRVRGYDLSGLNVSAGFRF